MLLRTFLTGTILAAGAFAQLSSFPKPSYFRETFSKTQTKVELKDPVRLKDFVVGDKLELSLKDYLALVMANNTDVQLQMLTLETPKNAIQRAFGVWDPVATAQFSSQRSTSPSTSALEGASELKTLSQPLSMTVQQTLPTGTNYTVSWGGQKQTTNSTFNNYNPALSSNLGINFSQPLLRNRGMYVNRLNLMSFRSRLRVSEYGMRTQVINLVSQAENAYWDVVSARENLRVALSAEETAKAFLELQQKQLDLGALSPLDIYQAEQSFATRKLDTAQSRFRLAQLEDVMRKQMGADLDATARKLPLVLTETVEVPDTATTVDREAAIDRANQNRPDLKGALQTLDTDDLSIQQSRNALLPNLALTGSYISNGRGGVFYQRTNVFSDTGGAPSSILTSTPGGLGDALGQMFGFGFSTYQLGLRLTLPIRSRAASADMADAVVRKKQDTLTLRNTQQTIRLGVLNAVTNLESARESVKLAKIALDYAVKNLDAANKKYELGTGLQLDVSNAQDRKVAAESQVVNNQIQVRKNLINLLVMTGTLLDERGIVVQP
jgi:outer membrane protein